MTSPTVTRRVELAALALAVSPLVLSAADDLQLIDPAQYAEIARRIVATGQLAHLHDNNGPYTDKPPVTFWLIAASLKLLGPTPFAVRLPSLLMGLLLLAVVRGIGAELWDATTGRRAALLLGGSLAFQLMVLDPKIDMIVTTFMAGAVYGAVLARRRPVAIVGAWISAALGLLTKGPIGLVAPVLALAPEGLRRRWGDADHDRGWRDRIGRFHPVLGLGIVAALVGPWLAESYAEFGPHGPQFLLWGQSFGRVFERSYRNDTTPLFFLHTALWAFLPFTLLLIDDLARRVASWRREGGRLPPDETRIALWWLGLTFVGISASSYKLPQYLFWLSPPAALLAAQALKRLDDPSAEKATRRWIGIHLLLGATGMAAVALLAGKTFILPKTEILAWTITAALPLVLAAAVRPWVASSSAVAVQVVAATLGFQLFLSGSFHRHLLAFQPERALGLRALEVDPGGEILPCVGVLPTSAEAFAAQRPSVSASAHDLLAIVAAGRAHVALAAQEAVPEIAATGLRIEPLLEGDSYPTSRLTLRFLDAATRPSTLKRLVLLRLTLP